MQVINVQEKMEKESESARVDAGGTTSGAAGQSSARDEPDVNQDHLRQVTTVSALCDLFLCVCSDS